MSKNKRMIDYIILSEPIPQYVDDLTMECLVAGKISEGYEPLGAPFYKFEEGWPTAMVQAMVKYEQE